MAGLDKVGPGAVGTAIRRGRVNVFHLICFGSNIWSPNIVQISKASPH